MTQQHSEPFENPRCSLQGIQREASLQEQLWQHTTVNTQGMVEAEDGAQTDGTVLVKASAAAGGASLPAVASGKAVQHGYFQLLDRFLQKQDLSQVQQERMQV